jgi:membrane protein YdbS with pleckstrin-like domain
MHLPKTKQSVNGSFVTSPQNVSFEQQYENESLYLLLRPHEITNVPWIISVFILLLVPLIGSGVIYSFFPAFFASLSPLYAFVLFMFWNLLVLTYAFYRYVVWFFSVYLVTNSRLVDVDFVGLFHKDYTETHIGNVQDVTSKTSGPIQVMFNFGLVYVQTASEQTEIEFEDVPQPDVVTKIIGDLVREQGGELKSKSSSGH